MAALFVLVAAVALFRLSRLTTVVLVVSLLGVPTAGLVSFALDPGPTHLHMIWLAFPFLSIGLAAAILRLVDVLPRRAMHTFRSLQRGAVFTLVVWAGLVLAI